MLIGSSMTQRAYDPIHVGFAIGLTHWYTRLADIILRGQDGFNSRWTLLGIDEIIGNYKPDLTVLFIGNNDATNSGQHIGISEYRANVIEIICKLRSVNNNMGIILLTPTKSTRKTRLDEVTLHYVESLKDISAKYPNCPVLDLWDGNFSINPLEDLCDGAHLNVIGNDKVLQGLKFTIRKYFPDLVPFNDILPIPKWPSEDSLSAEGSTDSDEGGRSDEEDSYIKKKKRLEWRFPSWRLLTGKSVEESKSIMIKSKL